MSRQARHKNIIFTGVPGIGKSTIIEKIVQRINRSKTGFYTREIRASGRRVGFTITTLDGERGTLAHIDIPGRMHPEFFCHRRPRFLHERAKKGGLVFNY